MRMAIPAIFEQLELQICVYLEHMWIVGDTKSHAGYFLSAVEHQLHVRKTFGATWRFFAVWHMES